MAKLRQHAAFAAAIERRKGIADDDQRVAAAKVARVERRAGVGPEAVVAVALFEVSKVREGAGPGGAGVDGSRRAVVDQAAVVAAAGAGDEAQADEVFTAERAWVVQRELAHQRHAAVLDLPIAQLAGLVGVVGHERLQHEGPVLRGARRPVFGHMGHEELTVLRVGARQHGTVAAAPDG